LLRRELGEDADVIEDLVVGAECPNAKPHPDPYLQAMSRLDAAPEQCVVFEDSRTGIRAGVAAKAAAIVGVRTSLSDEQLRTAGATASIESWNELTATQLREWVSR